MFKDANVIFYDQVKYLFIFQGSETWLKKLSLFVPPWLLLPTLPDDVICVESKKKTFTPYFVRKYMLSNQKIFYD